MATTCKRVYCLYRVSTKGQVDQNDIPLQRIECRSFAERQGWEIIKEFQEQGVSGFKVATKDRDAIQEMQHDAALGLFDVLLVFMFDRLGRRDDETPFVVEWFVRNGIEVWSAQEGQQKFDNHVDKLMNYIRFWQASGESIKTSVRTKTRLAQIVQEGKYRGGGCPYGYKLVKKGRLNKKNHELYEIEVDDEESEIVKLIFEKYVCEGFGAQRLNRHLLEIGIRNRSGKNFCNTTIVKMLKNIMYTGVLRSGETKSEVFPEFQIIKALFERIKASLTDEMIHSQFEQQLSVSKVALTQATERYESGSKELELYKSEVKKAIAGTSKFSVDTLNELINETKEKIAAAQQEIESAHSDISGFEQLAQKITLQFKTIQSWADMFETCSMEAQKMIVSQLISQVRISANYKIEIDLTVGYEKFSNYLEAESSNAKSA